MRSAVVPALVGALVLTSLPGAVATAGSATDDAAATATATATTEPATPTAPADVRPRIDALATPLGSIAEGPVPSRPAVAQQLADELGSQWLGPGNRRAITVRDALTGESLADRNSDRLMTPASLTKLLSAAAIVTGLESEHRFTTRVVAGNEPGQVIVVAGGDMLLGDGDSDPEAVAGHAGIADLAAQTAASLRGAPGSDAAAATGGAGDGAAQTGGAGADGPVTVALDLSHVQGPHAMPTWSPHWVNEGWTGRIVQLGREVDRALPFAPSPPSPEQEVARVFREALEREGIEVRGAGDEDAEAPVVEAAAGASELASVESAPLRDVLALALATSDNAMVEQLARQAAVAGGVSADQAAVTGWIVSTLTEDYGLDLTGMSVVDASGLSDGTRLSMRIVADVLVAGADGSHPALQEVLAGGGLPIAGLTGTLGNGRRFHLAVHRPALGNARAKTGTLPGVTALAGTVVTADGRLLVFAVAADQIAEDGGALEAASVLDAIAADLARCGC